MQYVLGTTMHKQKQITLIRYEPSYKQLEVFMKAEQCIFIFFFR